MKWLTNRQETFKVKRYYNLFYTEFGVPEKIRRDITYDSLGLDIVEKLKEVKCNKDCFELQEIKFNAKMHDIERQDLSKYTLAAIVFFGGVSISKINLTTNGILRIIGIISAAYVVFMLIDNYFFEKIKLKKCFYKMCLDAYEALK